MVQVAEMLKSLWLDKQGPSYRLQRAISKESKGYSQENKREKVKLVGLCADKTGGTLKRVHDTEVPGL